MCNAAAADGEAACGEAAVPSGDAEAPLFRVGVVTDVQYADIDDGKATTDTSHERPLGTACATPLVDPLPCVVPFQVQVTWEHPGFTGTRWKRFNAR
jgi:hypothetical protein